MPPTTLFGAAMIAITVLSYSLYSIAIKPFKERMILLFWINMFTYVGFLGAYYIEKPIMPEHPGFKLFEEYLFAVSTSNIPLYALLGMAFVASLVVLDNLYQRFDVSLVMPMAQMSLLFTAIGYICLGDPITWKPIVGIMIVFTGAIITSFPKLSMRDPLGPLRKIPMVLLAWGIVESLLLAAQQMITFTCTQKTGITDWLMQTLKHISALPFSSFNPFLYNVGSRLFIAIVFLLYLNIHKRYRGKIFSVLNKNKLYVFGVSAIYFASAFSYQLAFRYTTDKKVLSALNRTYIPVILIMSFFLLKEKIKAPKIVGSTLIVLGGLAAIVL